MPRQRWAVPCTALRHDHQPCRAWSVRGCFVCRKHGITGAAREWGAYRLWRIKIEREFLKEFREFDARLRSRNS